MGREKGLVPAQEIVTMNQKSPKTDPRQLILDQLRHPLKLRFIICLTMIGGWYFFFFMPLNDETETTTARIGREAKRIATAREIEQLKKDLAPYQGLIPVGANLSELMRQVIDHLRSSPLKLIDLKPGTPKDLGAYETIGLQLALEGEFAELDQFLGWIENHARHLRVDSIKIDPNQRDPGRLKAQITLLSLAEKVGAAPKTKPQPGEPRASKPKS
jgi:Tfp pilus assembly protein PilO